MAPIGFWWKRSWYKAGDQFERVVSFHRQYPHPNSAQLARFYADHDREPNAALKEARTAYDVYKT